MIYTVTFNPTLDYTVRLSRLELGKINRTEEETLYPGGKGINVSWCSTIWVWTPWLWGLPPDSPAGSFCTV